MLRSSRPRSSVALSSSFASTTRGCGKSCGRSLAKSSCALRPCHVARRWDHRDQQSMPKSKSPMNVVRQNEVWSALSLELIGPVITAFAVAAAFGQGHGSRSHLRRRSDRGTGNPHSIRVVLCDGAALVGAACGHGVQRAGFVPPRSGLLLAWCDLLHYQSGESYGWHNPGQTEVSPARWCCGRLTRSGQEGFPNRRFPGSIVRCRSRRLPLSRICRRLSCRLLWSACWARSAS